MTRVFSVKEAPMKLSWLATGPIVIEYSGFLFKKKMTSSISLQEL